MQSIFLNFGSNCKLFDTFSHIRNILWRSYKTLLSFSLNCNCLYYSNNMSNFYYSGEIERIVEIIKNRLYFGVTSGSNSRIIRNASDVVYFNVDEELYYINYYYDFGPLNISCLYKYCCKLDNLLQGKHISKKIVHYTSSDPNKRTNAAYLIGSFAVLYLKMDPRHIYKVLFNSGGPFR